MKKLLLLTAIITLVAVLAACTSFVKTGESSDVPSKGETVSTEGTSSDGTVVDETGKPADTSSKTENTSNESENVGGNESATSSSATSSSAASSSATSSQGSNTRPSGTSSTTSSNGGDNEGGWYEDWTPETSSSKPETETPVVPPTQDDETETPPTASTGSDWVDPDGPGWITGPDGKVQWW